MQAAIARSVSAETAAIYSEWQRFASDRSDKVNEMVSPSFGPDLLSDLLRPGNFMATGSQIFSRKWLEKIGGFDERHRMIEDVDLLLRLAMAGAQFRFAGLNRSAFLYRCRPNSVSNLNKNDFVEGCIRNADLVERYWRKGGKLTPNHARQLANIYTQGTRWFAERDHAKFELLIRKIEKLVPGFIPEGPRPLRYLSAAVSYRRAELLSVRYRRVKNAILSVSSFVNRFSQSGKAL